ncbi:MULTISPECIES: PP2C family protein-serine/threonine phosphatase [unclassified Streptomyces]|uniref:PP2C family protein-serine/threonine phosphatase n=1 Tax=unclassified Streptomyces TaxID=2593676 RepID=UPI000DBA5FB5|nr:MULTISPECIES: PP2C family protein-serine/threonine phosphatase [unclassified Streptomyces]MYT69300.1 SpoIIE family protein phosphatase [Streptomyces sp. SID8367]RAJ79686.1 serine phosphatase RsbU (regulator of sigma subunit) [Streptomyces sp. PsTaAH-137]
MTDKAAAHQRTTHRSLPELRSAVRALAARAHLPAELRTRLAQSVSRVAETELRAGRLVTLEAAPAAADRELTVRLRAPSASAVESLPLPAQREADTTVWRIPLPAQAPVPARRQPDPSPVELLEEELRAAVHRADSLEADRRHLTHELDETNSGVLALYVQLEERDEQLRRAHGQMLRELEDALRPAPIKVDGLELAIHYAPAGTDTPTGGDLYDWFQLPDGTVHITVVDALGHGVTSTRSALDVTHAVRTLTLEGHSLETIVRRTDEILLPYDRELMATVQLVRIDPVSGRIAVANGSHPPPLLVGGDGSARFLEVRGRGIGYPMAGSEGLRHERLDRDDLLVLYTDGLTESRRDPYEGERRLTAAAVRHRHRPTEEIPGALAQEMHTVILHPDDTLALTVRRSR